MDRGIRSAPVGTDIAGNGDLIAATEHPAMIAVDIGGSRQRRCRAQAGGEFAGAVGGMNSSRANDEDAVLIEPVALVTAEGSSRRRSKTAIPASSLRPPQCR
jgi:hypothetical protein